MLKETSQEKIDDSSNKIGLIHCLSKNCLQKRLKRIINLPKKWFEKKQKKSESVFLAEESYVHSTKSVFYYYVRVSVTDSPKLSIQRFAIRNCLMLADFSIPKIYESG